MIDKEDLKYLFASVFVLGVLSLVFVSSATAYSAASSGTLFNGYLFKQTIYLLIGMGLAQWISSLDESAFKELNQRVFIFSLFLLLLTLVPGVGVEVKGASRWVNLGLFRLQPSEIIKISFILYLSYALPVCSKRPKKFLGMVLVPYVIMIISFLNQPDLGSAVIVTIILSVASFFSFKNFSIKLLILIGFIGLISVILLVITSEYRMARIDSFLDPMGHAQTSGYQILQSFKSIANGGLFGLGWGNYSNFIPEGHTDYIFSTIVEQMGILYGIILSLSMMILSLCFLWVGSVVDSKEGSVFISVFAVTWMFEIFINYSTVLGLAPPKGLAFLLSYGGSQLVSHFIGFGICFAYGYQDVRGKIL